MNQKTLHISFPEDELSLYNEIKRQSSIKLIPLSALVRNYLKRSINTTNSTKSN